VTAADTINATAKRPKPGDVCQMSCNHSLSPAAISRQKPKNRAVISLVFLMFRCLGSIFNRQVKVLPHLVQKDFVSLYIKLKVWGDSNPFSYSVAFAFAAFF